MREMLVGIAIGVPVSAAVISLIIWLGWVRWRCLGYDHTFRQYFRIMWF